MSLQIEVVPTEYAQGNDDALIEVNRDFRDFVNSTGSDFRYAGGNFPLLRIRKLGQGTSATVYKSIMLDSLNVCAEKVFVVTDHAKKNQLISELKSLKLACVNDSSFIVRALDVYSNPFDGTLSLCLEYMDGGSLQDLVNSGGCKHELVISGIARQMLNGLDYLHKLRLIHRDLKPGNVLWSLSGRVKLADFGLSRTLELGQSLADTFVGTFDYMAPERLTGESYSFASDIWSYGLTVHAVAIGRYPYKAHKKGYWELLSATNDGVVPLPPSPPFSEQFCDFIACACRKEASVRLRASALLQHPFVKDAPEILPSGSLCYLKDSNRTKQSSSTVETAAPSHLLSSSPNATPVFNNTVRDVGAMDWKQKDEVGANRQVSLQEQQQQQKSSSGTAKSRPFINRDSASLASISTALSAASGALTLRDMHKLVRCWKHYILECNQVAFSSTNGSSTRSDSNNLRHLDSPSPSQQKQPQQAHVITEQVLNKLACDLECDATILRQCFRHAILDIRKQFRGSVATISDTISNNNSNNDDINSSNRIVNEMNTKSGTIHK